MTITFLRNRPKKFFFKKPFKRKVYNKVKSPRISANTVQCAHFGLKALESGRVRFSQISAIRKMFLFYFRSDSDLVIRLEFNSPLTKKSLGVRMGRGKGKLSHWVASVKKGQVVFELSGNFLNYKKSEALRLIRQKFSLRLVLVKKLIF